MKPETLFVNANGIRFHCATAGEGPLCLCIHGFPETHHSWRNQIPLLARRFKVVAPDMRGYGLSDVPRKVAEYRLPILLEDIKGLIEAFGHKEAVIVSHDWGAVMAVHFAETYPEMVTKLAWSNGLELFDEYDLVVRERNLRQVLKSWYVTMNLIPGNTEFFGRLNNYFALKLLVRFYAVRKHMLTDEVMDEWMAALGPAGLAGGVNYYRAAMWALNEIRAGRLRQGRITCPVRVIWGETDRALERELAYRIENHCDGGYEFTMIRNCGHWLQQEAPEEYNKLLAEFLELPLD